MDDFIFVILLNQGSEEEREELLKMRKDARYNLYTEGPQSGVEDKISWLGKSTRVWAGMQLRVEDTGVVCKTHNKNEESIIRHDEQRYPRYTPGASYQDDRVRKSTMLGSEVRLRNQCPTDNDYLEVLELDLWENIRAGTHPKAVEEALKRMKNRTGASDIGWKKKKAQIKKNLTARQRILDSNDG